MTDELKERRSALRRGSRWLHGHGHDPAHEELARVAAWSRDQGIEADVYGEGEDLQAFEARVAELLGQEAGRFFISGSMAQPIALRLWAEREGRFQVGMHPTCHLELHEHRGYRHLHGLDVTLVGPARRPMLVQDLDAVTEPLAAVVVELPTRENGGQLPSWEELEALSGRARERGIHPHLDGARLWEAQAAYGRPFPEICALFDSVYVSFYKGIGALAGAMLLGPRDLIDEAAVWQRRQGGNLYHSLPNWGSAAMLLEGRLPRFAHYRKRALELAAALGEVDGVQVLPDPPHANLFHLVFEAEPEALLTARDRVAEERELWLLGHAKPTDLPGQARTELYVGEAALVLEPAEVARAMGELMEYARGG